MRNLSSELAYFTLKLGQAWAQEVAQGRALPDGIIAAEVAASPFQLDPEEIAWLVRELEGSFTTSQARGSSVFSDFKPWLRDKRAEIDFYYWNRLRRYYLEGGVIQPQVVATLDNVTDELLDFSGNPKDSGIGSRRGMVIGHVQSGKTTNYSALICKAADAGYRTILLLAGITNTLRSQTQERLDETFIGKKSVFHALAQEPLPILTYAATKRFPAYGTSRGSDFTRNPGGGVVFGLAAHNEPIIFITKKNKAPLTKLKDWLIEQGHGATITSPLLLIDDEADNASINTAKDPGATTAINAVIREILNLFERSTYIGYTATPFANIFIDPDTSDAMLQDDLFPKHFIKALDPPSNYVGAARVFADDGDLRPTMVQVVRDYAQVLPLKHKSDDPVMTLPGSLLTAMRVFVLSRAIRILRGQGRQHCSMMINVSRFNAIQEKVYGLVYTYLDTLKNSTAVSAGLGSRALADPVIAAMKEDFDREYAEAGFTFDNVLTVLREAAASIVPVTVNMKGGVLDYRGNREQGLHVIAIGGLALSRGLTLEGLTVSYILRNTAASDTLMQMARWFGYRPNFEDICRVYLPNLALDHYKEIHEAIEELRTEVRRMQDLGMTPEHFGLKVRESPTAIKITAANKMRSATQMTVAADYSERHLEGYILPNDRDANVANLEEVRRFISELGEPSEAFTTDQTIVWRGVSGLSVMALLRGFSFPSAHGDLGPIQGGTSLFMDYVSDRLSDEMALWDVAVPHPRSGDPSPEVIVPGRPFPLRQRSHGDVVEGGWRVTGGRNRVADPNDALIALSQEQLEDAAEEKNRVGGLRGDKAYCAQRTRPLLLIHVFTTQPKVERKKLTDPVVSLSFCLPPTNKTSTARTYQVNAVYRRQLEAEANSEAEDDEAILEAE
ncbi:MULTISPECIES: Z1 domain-containing protein [unclassified Bradyrhizobium]|uniref:Z1 domain-containing protein n=1 Tax=unclassified Bradyrhizobium TaxID=2631580 RepID=UPI0028E2FAD7|nr:MULTISPECIES: Z1 domain-containing protein [unclassified Bradyrhizobium]